MKKSVALTGILFLLINTAFGQKALLKEEVNWKEFMSGNDLIWNKLPTGWGDQAFLGNGLLGTGIWQDGTSNLHFEISRTDVYDHRNDYSAVIGRCRLPNGHFKLSYAGANPTGSMRMDLWNAEASAKVKTNKGNISVRAFTHALEKVTVVEITADGEERNARWTWHPDTSKTPVPTGIPTDYRHYPLQTQEKVGDVNVSVQSMPEGEIYKNVGKGVGQYATAWKVVDAGNGKKLVYISEGFSFPGTKAKQEAVDAVNTAVNQGLAKLEVSHRSWWKNYYQKSFLSIPDSRIQSFYWIQMYKMGSASRGNGPVIDLLGPWYTPTKWPAIWWNLNIQLAYSPFYVSNHNDIAGSLVNVLYNNRDMLTKNSKFSDSYNLGRSAGIDLERTVGTECADLTYALHNVWQQYKATMDDELLRNKLYPLMRGNFNFYRHIMEKRADGKIHIPNTGSPEYPGGDKLDDTNYTLALVKWLAKSMIYANERLKLNDPIMKDCKDVVSNLAPYPVNSTGFLVGKDMPFEVSHRHWSHLFMIYPLYEVTYDNKDEVNVIETSLKNWLNKQEAFRGYSRAGAASIYALGGYGNDALKYMDIFLDPKIRFALQPNTLYKEGGPVIETPFYGARTVQDMVFQSYNDIIRVFPAIPDAWKDVTFNKFRAEGAFLVSAKREQGRTVFVQVESLAGEVCKVKTDLGSTIKAYGNRAFNVKNLGNNVVEIDLRKGESVVLYAGSNFPDLTIQPVQFTDKPNYWGVK